MNETFRIFLLGAPQFLIGDRPISGWPSRAAEAIIAYVVTASSPVPRSKLADLLWPESDPKQANSNLRTILAPIRKQLGDYIVIDRHTVGRNSDAPIWIDCVEFTNTVTPTASLSELVHAVDLYHDSFLAGLDLRKAYPFDEWLAVERERLERVTITALQRLATAYLHTGDYVRGENYAQRWLSLDQFSDDAMQTLLWLQLRQGKRHVALQQYAAFAQLLADELGIVPTKTTQAVAQRARAMGQFGAGNVQSARTPFVGRQSELAKLLAHVRQPEAKLTTLHGMGGMGKTRLAHAFAQLVLAQERGLFLDGVWFVELAAVGNANALLSALIHALGLQIQEGANSAEILHTYLRNRECLLILDNFEQLTGDSDSIGMIAEIVRIAPAVKLLVTSRERLHLYEEVVIDVAGLDASAELFTTYAQRHAQWVTTADQQTIAAICEQLHHVPLAVELAAGRAREQSLEEIAASIANSIDSLATRLHNVPARHRTVRAAFETSFAKLDPTTQSYFAQLALFRGGFTADAANKIADIPHTVLRQLVDRSLLNFRAEEWFVLHELLRQFAEELLGDGVDVRENHSRFYLDLLRKRERIQLETGDNRLSADCAGTLDHWPNIRKAWRWAVQTGAVERITPAVLPLMRDAQFHGWGPEAIQLLEMVEGIDSTDSILLGRTQLALGYLWRVVGNNEKGISYLEHALATLPESAQADHAQAHLWLARCYFAAKQSERALTTIRTATTLLRAVGDTALEAIALRERYHIVTLTNSNESADKSLLKALQLKTYPRYRAEIVKDSGSMAVAQGRFQDAITIYEEAHQLGQQIGDQMIVATTTANMALAHGYLGHLAEAERLSAEAMEHYHRYNQQQGVAGAQLAIASAAIRNDDFARAATLYGDNITIYRAINRPHLVGWMRAHQAMCLARIGSPDALATCRLAAQELLITNIDSVISSGLPALADCIKTLGHTALGIRLAHTALAHPLEAGSREIGLWVVEACDPAQSLSLREALAAIVAL